MILKDVQLPEPLLQVIELAWRLGRSESVRLDWSGNEIARIIGPSRRGLLYRAARDSVRGMRRMRRFLEERDVVITAFGKPIAVIVSTEEYVRLTGKKLRIPPDEVQDDNES